MLIKPFIISRGRSDTMTSHLFFPNATLVVAEEEEHLYAKYDMPIISYPNDWIGLSMPRNMLLNTHKDACVLFIDDDLQFFYDSLRNKRYTYEEQHYMQQVILNTAECAYVSGAKMFGWLQTPNNRYVNPLDPISYTTWLGSIYGNFPDVSRSDVNLRFKGDIDKSLNELKDSRIVYMDKRYSFYCVRDMNVGGLSAMKTGERYERDKRYIKNKWGKYVDFTSKSGKAEKTALHVRRRQELIF